MEPPSRFELETPSLPWKCSTTELRRQPVDYISINLRLIQEPDCGLGCSGAIGGRGNNLA